MVNALLSPRFATVGVVVFAGLALYTRQPIFIGLAVLFAALLLFSILSGGGSAKIRESFNSQPPANQEFLLKLRRDGERQFASSTLVPRPGIDMAALEQNDLVVTTSTHTYGGQHQITEEVWGFLGKHASA